MLRIKRNYMLCVYYSENFKLKTMKTEKRIIFFLVKNLLTVKIINYEKCVLRYFYDKVYVNNCIA